MKTNTPKPTGRTSWDFVSDLLARKSLVASLAVIAWALVIGIGYLWSSGKLSLTSASQTHSEGQGSPFVHWEPVITELPLKNCAAFIREVYELTGPVVTEGPVTNDFSVAQLGVAGSVNSVIICVRAGEKTTVTVVSAGPDQTK